MYEQGLQAEKEGRFQDAVAIWEKVLEVERIGITDNFFNVGGDSIKAIQVIARLKKYRLTVKISDLFSHLVIKELSRYVTEVKLSTPQETVQGEVELTPIQHWFFQSDFTGKHHFNHALMLYRQEGFAKEILLKVFTKILHHHDALRMVYTLEQRKLGRAEEQMSGKRVPLGLV